MKEITYSTFCSLLRQDTITLSEDIKVLPSKTQISDKILYILTSDLKPSSFSGVLEGNGHVIYNPPDMLFSEISEGGVVKDVTISQCTHNSAAVVCETNNGRIENVTVDRGSPDTDNLSGGLVKENNGVITKCCCNASIESEKSVGGISRTNSGEISDCSMSGNIYSEFEVGGICGVNIGSIKNSEVTGSNIKGASRVGGIVGKNEVEISSCEVECITVASNSSKSTHPVKERFGGISGMNSGEITDVTVSGSIISGNICCGGLVGKNSGDIQNSMCHSSDISGKKYIGGVSGESSVDGVFTRLIAEKCVVRGKEYVGGVVGQLSSDSCVDCISNTSVCSPNEDLTGLLFGELKMTSIDSCIYYGSNKTMDLVGKSFYTPSGLKAYYDSSKEEVLAYVTLQ